MVPGILNLKHLALSTPVYTAELWLMKKLKAFDHIRVSSVYLGEKITKQFKSYF